jgi:GNAT superfamily N-acetyltransferase
MQLRSLGYRTDLIFPGFDGEIIDRGNYLVIRTPKNPTFYWGNFLLFSEPPKEGDLRSWGELFAAEIGVPPAVEHQTFGWDSPEGEEGAIEPFLQAGFRPDRGVVMTAAAPRAPVSPSHTVGVRALSSDTDWEQAVENQVTCKEPEFEHADYQVFRQRAMERYRRMSLAGLGNWFGAFIDGRLVADCGLFHDGELGRYQSVETHPDFRRKGIAATMVYDAGRQAIARYGLRKLVMVAEAASDPARLYASLGFREEEKMIGLLKPPARDSGAGEAT